MNKLLKIHKLLKSINTILYIIVMELFLFIPSILVSAIFYLIGFNEELGGS